jgi:NAD(P)-dependent dehydrogenase (short-subunit alcohol dehydrogenase family)
VIQPPASQVFGRDRPDGAGRRPLSIPVEKLLTNFPDSISDWQKITVDFLYSLLRCSPICFSNIRGDAVVAKVRSTGGRADFLGADLSQADRVRTLAAAATNLTGHVDVLVNCAGLFPFGPAPQVAVDEFDAVFDVNVRAPYFLVAELAPARRSCGVTGPCRTAGASHSPPRNTAESNMAG